jgi:hypothetical protein
MPVTVLFFARIWSDSADSERSPLAERAVTTVHCGPVSPWEDARDFILRRSSVYK